MRKPVTRRSTKHSTCQLCGGPLETAATTQNPSATIRANSLARCPSCLVLCVIGADLQPSSNLSDDEASFEAALNANTEVKEGALKTLETARIRTAAEIKTECIVAREWLIARGDPDLSGDLASLDAYAAGFDERGFTRATSAIRLRATGILARMDRQTRH